MILFFPYLTDYLILGKETLGTLAAIGETAADRTCFWCVPALLHRFGLSLMTSYKLFILLSLTVTARWAYRAGKLLWQNPHTGLCAALLYLVNPLSFRLLYTWGTITGVMLYSLIPVLICLILQLFCRRPGFRKAPEHNLLTKSLWPALPFGDAQLVLFTVMAFDAAVTVYLSNRLLFTAYPYSIHTLQDMGEQAAALISPWIWTVTPVSLLLLLLCPLCSFLSTDPEDARSSSERNS